MSYTYWEQTLDEREIAFSEQYINDLEKLRMRGVSLYNAQNRLDRLRYVKIYKNQPWFMFPVKSLPNGYKWADGEKIKVGKSTYQFLAIDDELYIRGYLMAGMNIKDKKFVRIHDWKQLTVVDIREKLENSNIADAIIAFGRKHGMKAGYVVPVFTGLRYDMESWR